MQCKREPLTRRTRQPDKLVDSLWTGYYGDDEIWIWCGSAWTAWKGWRLCSFSVGLEKTGKGRLKVHATFDQIPYDAALSIWDWKILMGRYATSSEYWNQYGPHWINTMEIRSMWLLQSESHNWCKYRFQLLPGRKLNLDMLRKPLEMQCARLDSTSHIEKMWKVYFQSDSRFLSG